MSTTMSLFRTVSVTHESSSESEGGEAVEATLKAFAALKSVQDALGVVSAPPPVSSNASRKSKRSTASRKNGPVSTTSDNAGASQADTTPRPPLKVVVNDKAVASKAKKSGRGFFSCCFRADQQVIKSHSNASTASKSADKNEATGIRKPSPTIQDIINNIPENFGDLQEHEMAVIQRLREILSLDTSAPSMPSHINLDESHGSPVSLDITDSQILRSYSIDTKELHATLNEENAPADKTAAVEDELSPELEHSLSLAAQNKKANQLPPTPERPGSALFRKASSAASKLSLKKSSSSSRQNAKPPLSGSNHALPYVGSMKVKAGEAPVPVRQRSYLSAPSTFPPTGQQSADHDEPTMEQSTMGMSDEDFISHFSGDDSLKSIPLVRTSRTSASGSLTSASGSMSKNPTTSSAQTETENILESLSIAASKHSSTSKKSRGSRSSRKHLSMKSSASDKEGRQEQDSMDSREQEGSERDQPLRETRRPPMPDKPMGRNKQPKAIVGAGNKSRYTASDGIECIVEIDECLSDEDLIQTIKSDPPPLNEAMDSIRQTRSSIVPSSSVSRRGKLIPLKEVCPDDAVFDETTVVSEAFTTRPGRVDEGTDNDGDTIVSDAFTTRRLRLDNDDITVGTTDPKTIDMMDLFTGGLICCRADTTVV